MSTDLLTEEIESLDAYRLESVEQITFAVKYYSAALKGELKRISEVEKKSGQTAL